MSRYHRENPDLPIQHDWFAGHYVGVDPGAGKDWTVMTPPVEICELCGETNPSNPCLGCIKMCNADLIEQAHETISGWKRLLIAAAIANGGQTVISAEQMMEAETRRIEMSVSPSWDVRITVQ